MDAKYDIDGESLVSAEVLVRAEKKMAITFLNRVHSKYSLRVKGKDQAPSLTVKNFGWLRHMLVQLSVLSPLMSGASDFGTTGVITIPSARQMKDGHLSATLSSNVVSNMYNVSYQLTPFIEGVFRYSVFNPYGRSYSNDGRRDRSFEIKARLSGESELMPEISVGLRDALGTGIWGGEYLVGTKKFGPLDLTLGIGWGRFSQTNTLRNPLSVLGDEFDERPFLTTGRGGEVRGNTFFRGPTGVFWGARYKVDSLPISLMIEQNSDAYNREVREKSFVPESNLNWGIEWEVNRGVRVLASHQKGAFTSIAISTDLNFKENPPRKFENVESILDPAISRRAPVVVNTENWFDRMLYDAERSGLKVYSAEAPPGSKQLRVKVSNEKYQMVGDALDQAATLLQLHAPKEVDSFSLSIVEEDFPVFTIDYPRGKTDLTAGKFLRAAQSNNGLIRLAPFRDLRRPSNVTLFSMPRLSIGADLAMRFQLMDPVNPLKQQVLLKPTAQLEITQSTSVWVTGSVDLWNDFDTKRESDSVLPRVRTELNKYLTEGATGIDSFYLENRKVVSDVLVRSYVGILEEMFSGAGFEILYEPFASRFALGANLNFVVKRDYDQLFGLQDYNVATGHLSLFYASPFYNFDFGMHVGRYLARDAGYTFEARRTFDNGFSIGAFFTRTNVSVEDFGEGGFDKGFFIRIPISQFTKGNSKAAYKTILRPIERDGGRRLEGFAGELWWDRRGYRFDSLTRQLSRIRE